MRNKWDERYSQDEYIYGKEPNEFFKQELLKYNPGKILLPADGEGRNGVYAAKLGWDVYCFDSSLEAQKKANRLAMENEVKIRYSVSSFDTVDYPDIFFDVVGLFYAHMYNRTKNHKKMCRFLKQRGILMLEGFSKKQIHNNSGGPHNVELLFSKEELQFDFAELSELNIWEKNIDLNEGKLHSGTSSLIRLIGQK